MWAPPRIQDLTGGRLHLSHGPIDLVLKAWGQPADVASAYAAATERFEAVLGELVADLAELRRPMSDTPAASSPVARRMVEACRPFAPLFLTPMAAVAGSVADELLAVMLAAAPDLTRAYVNDGGDIAVHIAASEALSLAIAGDFSGGIVPGVNGRIRLTPADGIGGIATSGQRGRSFSLGIADSVTVLARTAAMADAAATLIANAVDLDHPLIVRRPACTLDPDSDLGDRLVTVDVPRLSSIAVDQALGRGGSLAEDFIRRGLIASAALMLQGHTATAGSALLSLEETCP